MSALAKSLCEEAVLSRVAVIATPTGKGESEDDDDDDGATEVPGNWKGPATRPFQDNV